MAETEPGTPRFRLQTLEPAGAIPSTQDLPGAAVGRLRALLLAGVAERASGTRASRAA